MNVSVIVPSLPERWHSLHRLLGQIAEQSHAPVEVLVGVDYQREGPHRVRNRLVRAATSEFVAFIDDDDEITPNHLELLAAHALGHDVIWSLCEVKGREWSPDHRCPPHLMLQHFNSIPMTSLVRRSLFLEVGGFIDDKQEDWRLWQALEAAGASFRCVHDITWTYHFTGHNRSLGGV